MQPPAQIKNTSLTSSYSQVPVKDDDVVVKDLPNGNVVKDQSERTANSFMRRVGNFILDHPYLTLTVGFIALGVVASGALVPTLLPSLYDGKDIHERNITSLANNTNTGNITTSDNITAINSLGR